MGQEKQFAGFVLDGATVERFSALVDEEAAHGAYHAGLASAGASDDAVVPAAAH
ncbi:hypothetical protein Kpho02_17000 [Kitasatospora phosalacinea]|uniref:Uncharacterized protein n=1 Tax=Kitasatospora phosalacinea TaxID=2065 RepID=A0A9W6Q5Z4_9ACTN|nr:hypothetical protein [Kitasatospora phosalacinea]GLW69401.1 hypothetical protein Kpho02_17000 [Kitasatospora phosalacinea]